MARLPVPSKVIRGFQYVLENDFTGGLKTEFTGLNFPENACTSTQNCTFFHTGSVFRRNGFDYESNYALYNIDRTNQSVSGFVWTNVGGDGNTKIYVQQVGGFLYFYNITNTTASTPLSQNRIASIINIANFISTGGTLDITAECQFAAGNGYLFVFHPNCDPFYCTYIQGIVSASMIDVQIRDFLGVTETGVADNVRPLTLSTDHQYNIANQGWGLKVWTSTSTSTNTIAKGNQTFTIGTGLPINVGDMVIAIDTAGLPSGPNMVGPVVSYNSGTGVLVFNCTIPAGAPGPYSNWIVSAWPGLISFFQGAAGVYPSNSDVWWTFKDSTLNFNPAATLGNVTLDNSPAPKGYFILDAFRQRRSTASSLPGITDVTTTVRPKTGTWFAGRVWYTGVDAAQPATGDAQYYTWTENIYFSQIVTKPTQFGLCYQVNDPTSETSFDVLPNDGGVITIQGSGSIYKLFPMTNGLLVFATNGIWFITGSTGIGFTAVDYTISKLSAIQSISPTSYVDILGYPMFWNEEGIYTVTIEAQQQGLSVNSLTLNTIKQFYDQIPKQSKKYARGAYNPITGQVQWVYRSANESTVTDRYQFDSVLTLSMFTQAFYTWNIGVAKPGPYGPYVNDIQYITYTGLNAPPPVFKYLTSTFQNASFFFTFSEERDNINWKDWNSTGFTVDYTSSFITGYRLHGDAQRKWQVGYAYIYSDNAVNTSYKFQGHWDYSISGNSGKFTTEQVVVNTVNPNNFSKVRRRHKLRGRGTVLQLQISSVSGKPFKIDGWSLWEIQNASV